MTLSIYGEIAIDYLVDYNCKIERRWGGAGLYAAIAAVRQGQDVEFMTVYGPDLGESYLGFWGALGISFKQALYKTDYSIPRYVVTGFRGFETKVSRPTTSIKLGVNYSPRILENCTGFLVFPIDHSLPKSLCIEAYERGIPVLLDPKPHENSIAEARDVLQFTTILLVNEEEVRLLAEEHDSVIAANKLLSFGPQYVIVKQGVKGCFIASKTGINRFSAFVSKAVCTLGSGDIFGGVLAATYLRTKDLTYSVRFASCVAANFIEQITTEGVISRLVAEVDVEQRPVNDISMDKRPSIYLAGPFFCSQEVIWVNSVCERLENMGFQVLSPSRDNGVLTLESTIQEKEETFKADIELLEQSDILVALIDHDDPGTNFEIGYAFKKGIPVIGFQTSTRPLNNMIAFGSVCICRTFEQLVLEVYKHVR